MTQNLAKLPLNCNVFEWVSLSFERHDITPETQAMLLLTLLVPVPQNTLFPLISLWLADEARVQANNGQISREYLRRHFFAYLHIYMHTIVDLGQRFLNYLHVISLFQTSLNFWCINCSLFPDNGLVVTADRVSDMKSHRGGASLALSDSVWRVVVTTDLTCWVTCWA